MDIVGLGLWVVGCESLGCAVEKASLRFCALFAVWNLWCKCDSDGGVGLGGWISICLPHQTRGTHLQGSCYLSSSTMLLHMLLKALRLKSPGTASNQTRLELFEFQGNLVFLG